jgi:hypothetical protein
LFEIISASLFSISFSTSLIFDSSGLLKNSLTLASNHLISLFATIASGVEDKTSLSFITISISSILTHSIERFDELFFANSITSALVKYLSPRAFFMPA